ncbi:MAG: hypothetical protein KGH54_02480 [Candidatus Micrarchaeota archaeon]|nr:hypothetical protein [Candidatus Micrarchaeota archaeon]
MKDKTKPMDFTPQQIMLAKELVKKIQNGDLKANAEFHDRFNDAQREDLFRNHLRIPQISLKEFRKNLKIIIREEDKKFG